MAISSWHLVHIWERIKPVKEQIILIEDSQLHRILNLEFGKYARQGPGNNVHRVRVKIICVGLN